MICSHGRQHVSEPYRSGFVRSMWKRSSTCSAGTTCSVTKALTRRTKSAAFGEGSNPEVEGSLPSSNQSGYTLSTMRLRGLQL